MTWTCVRAVAQGGGHGGSGGHGGGHGGHWSGGSSAGHSPGHAMGHSFAHLFGHHAHGARPAARKGAAAPERAEVTPRPESVSRVSDRQPKNRFVFWPRLGLLPRRNAFGFGGCPYGWFDHDFRTGDDGNCSNAGFFFDGFFSGWFSGPLANGPAFGDTTWFAGGTTADSTAESPAEPNLAYPPTNSDLASGTVSSSRNPTLSPGGMKAEQRITLLQLRDGSMYGLTDYWVTHGELHYTTTYGGRNSLPLERIDFERTVQLNADRGVPFVLPPQASRQMNSSQPGR
jgi:hypothetical protein